MILEMSIVGVKIYFNIFFPGVAFARASPPSICILSTSGFQNQNRFRMEGSIRSAALYKTVPMKWCDGDTKKQHPKSCDF